MSENTKEQIIAMYVDGKLSAPDIARALGIKKHQVYCALEKAEIPRRKERAGGFNAANLVGREFGESGQLVVIREHGRNNQKVTWLCLCKCGRTTIKTSGGLCSGRSTHCGCKKADMMSHKGWKGYGELSGDYWSQLQRGARNRNIPFEISIEHAWKLFEEQNRLCAISGVELVFAKGSKLRSGQQTASLDRKCSDVGYLPDNIQWVHKDVNFAKQDKSDSEFIEMCFVVANHQRRMKEKQQ